MIIIRNTLKSVLILYFLVLSYMPASAGPLAPNVVSDTLQMAGNFAWIIMSLGWSVTGLGIFFYVKGSFDGLKEDHDGTQYIVTNGFIKLEKYCF